MTRNAREQSKNWLMLKMSLGLLLLSMLLPAFVQNAAATSGGQIIQFKTDAYSVDEDAGSITVRVVRTGGSLDTVTGVTYCTCEDSAVDPEDFIHSPGTLIFYKGEQEKTITVPIIDDNFKEDDEQFFVWLIATTGGAALGNSKKAIVTIHDNDPTGSTPAPTPPPTSSPTSPPTLAPTSPPSLENQNNEPSLLSLAVVTPAPENMSAITTMDTASSPTPTSIPAPTPTPKITSKQAAALPVQGGITDMPDTATPWYNYMVVGSLLVLLSGTMLYRRIAAFRRE